MIINAKNLFLNLAAFMLLVDVLVGLDINAFYIRAVLAFLFITIVPGLLVMLIMRIREFGFWEYLVYTVGLSISFIMFAGLAVNWILPWLNITDKPLSLWPILLSFNLFLLIMMNVAYRRNKDLHYVAEFPQLDTINNIFFIIPMLFPVMAILGAFILNNNGPNTITMIMLGSIAVYVFLLVLFRKRLNENVYPWSILFISLSLLLMFSMRSWYITGWDISQEQYLFRNTLENGIWFFGDNIPYNSCLSVSVMPVISDIFLNINIQYYYKLIFQIIFIFHSLTIFLLFKKFANKLFSFIASFLYFGSGYFNSTFPSLIRQEIAFLFFGLMLLSLFTKGISGDAKKVFFVIFGVSMIVSHYSTSYIGMGIFAFTYFISLFYKIYEDKKMSSLEKSEFYLTGSVILLLLIFTFIWNAQITDVSRGIIKTIKISFDNIQNSFSDDLKQSTIQSALFGIRNVEGYNLDDLNKYINQSSPKYDSFKTYDLNKTKSFTPQILKRESFPPKDTVLAKIFIYVYYFIKYFLILSFIFGSFLIYFMKNDKIKKEFVFMSFLSVLFILSIIILPYISKEYNFERLFQQSLIFLSFCSLFAFYFILKRFESKIFFVAVTIYLLYCLFNLGFFIFIVGGDPTLNLYNNGWVYNSQYTHYVEISSISWIQKINPRNTVYLDPQSNLKFYAFAKPIKNKILAIYPSMIKIDSYVFLNYPNVVDGLNYIDGRPIFNKGILIFNTPVRFLEDNKNKIYNNGGSEIFK